MVRHVKRFVNRPVTDTRAMMKVSKYVRNIGMEIIVRCFVNHRMIKPTDIIHATLTDIRSVNQIGSGQLVLYTVLMELTTNVTNMV